MTDTVETLLTYSRENGRVCPMPMKWSQLWEMLPERRQVGDGWDPALPPILAAWYDVPAIKKMHRLEEHIQWAAKHGKLEDVSAFLRGLQEDDWCHIGEY